MSFAVPSEPLDQCGVPEILDSLADGTYITNLQRSIVYWNQAAARITGWTAKEVVGRTCYDEILNHVDLDGHALCGQDFCPLHRAIITGQSSTASLLVSAKHKDGHRVPLEVSVSPIRNPAGEVIGGIEVFRDLTMLMDDLRRARLIQDHLLPGPLPEDARITWETRYTPEEIVGGDFYRIERLDRDHYAVMIADIMGHGVASALFTVYLRSLWEEYRQHLSAPGSFATVLNRRLHKLVSADGYFATVFLLVLDASTGQVRYVRAGHPPALVIHGDGSSDVLAACHPAIGLRENTEYDESPASLNPGEALLLYTDGASEILNAQEVELTVSGLKSLVQKNWSPRDGLNLQRFEDQLLAYSGGLRLSDDLTLAYLQWHPTTMPA